MPEFTGGVRRIVCKIADKAAPRGIVTGWAYVTNDENGKQTVDHSGEFIRFDDLEEAFERAFTSDDLPESGVLHLADGGAKIIGQITLNGPERRALGFGDGPWGAVIKVRVLDPKLLGLIRSGKLSQFSMEGTGEEIEEEIDNAEG